MVPDLFFDQLVLVALVWLCLLLQWAWSSDTVACPPLALSGENIQTPLSSEIRSALPIPFLLIDDHPMTDTQGPFQDAWGGDTTWIGRRC